jgi:TIR domain
MSSPDIVSPKVFISYAWDSSKDKNRILQFANRLRDRGIDCTIDEHVRSSLSEGWPSWIAEQVRESDFILIVCTALYLSRYLGKEEPYRGRGVSWECKLMSNDLYSKAPTPSTSHCFLKIATKIIFLISCRAILFTLLTHQKAMMASMGI